VHTEALAVMVALTANFIFNRWDLEIHFEGEMEVGRMYTVIQSYKNTFLIHVMSV
jgi:hypothetical protein